MPARNDEIFQEVAKAFEGLDVGRAALFEMIGMHLHRELYNFCTAMTTEAYLLLMHGAPGMTNTELFLEVFKRVSFTPIKNGVHSPTVYAEWVKDMEQAAKFLIAYAVSLRSTEPGCSRAS